VFAVAAATTFVLATALPAWAIEPAVCPGCKPPLVYTSGGVVMSASTAGVTVTPIFWEPSGGQYKFPAGYERIVDGFILDVAVASPSTDNVFSVPTEYYQVAGRTRTSVTYRIFAGAPIVDTAAFPSNGCTPAPGYTACITDAQLQTELTAITNRQHLLTNLANFYPVFLPPKVETKGSDGTTSIGGFCGYHSAFRSGANETVYANMPYESSGCGSGQAPNGSLVADGEVSTLSRELNEAITDPVARAIAWTDRAGNEIGDMCEFTYGRPLGSTASSDPGHTEYNQVINGGMYYLQREFSNFAFSKFGLYNGCSQGEDLANSGSSASSGSSQGQAANSHAATALTIINDATPATLPADGKSTAEVSVGVRSVVGYMAVPGDPIHFSVGVKSGAGRCGTLSASDKSTNSAGNADITYTASTSNVSCWVVGVDANEGRSAEAVIYQGTTQKQSPTFNASFPTSLPAGGSTTFTIKAANPTSEPLPGIRPKFDVFPATGATRNVKASQVELSYSTTGPNGSFTPVRLVGGTITDGAANGWVGPPRGITLAPDSTTTYTFHIALASDLPVSGHRPLIALESFLDQINPADGTAATLADTYENIDIEKHGTIGPSNAIGRILIPIGAAIMLAIASFLIWRRARKPPRGPPPQPTTP
jgi:hypothetical protein